MTNKSAELQKQFVAVLAKNPPLAEELGRLPHKDLLKVDDIARHVVSLDRFHGERAAWHMRRAAGFGSSDIGSILRTFNPTYANETGFGDGFKVIAQKLLQRLPDFENEHMRRGTLLEDLVRRTYRARYGLQTDEAALKTFAQTPPSREAPWLRGQPDDIVMIGNKRFLIDYKVPNQPSNEVEFDYKAQLHHLLAHCENAGIQIDGVMLVKLNLPPVEAQQLVNNSHMSPELLQMKAEMLAQQDSNNIKHNMALAEQFHPGDRAAQAEWLKSQPVGLLQLVKVERDEQLMRDMLATGTQVWNQTVMQGVMPKPKLNAFAEMSEETLASFNNPLMAYAKHKQMESFHKRRAAEAKDDFVGRVQAAAIDAEAYDWPRKLVSVRSKQLGKEEAVALAVEHGALPDEISKPVPSVDAMKAKIAELGGDPEAPELAELTPDGALAADWLKEHGISTADPTGDLVLRVSASKANKQFLEEQTAGAISAAEHELNDATQDEAKPTVRTSHGPSM